ncbi:MAG: DNA-binding protein WhiA [Bacilli bacterium]|nr:DNA-binding protein WhiA [Bacilli bacterium]MDD3305348.1 DNA-binding protein WhiA [Bacilli bacterium]MDD4053249.1 DNA-binding protein WhiA [Bacilli bacterium]MDD4411227.1 DNA-binding protein WhiA [Bacilli bacterium]
MSFSTDVKNEVVRIDNTNLENVALLSAYIRQNAYIDNKIIRIHTENAAICRYLFKIVKNVYDVTSKIIIRKNFNFKKNLVYIMEVSDKKDFILKDLSLLNDQSYFINIPKEYIIGDDELKKVYLRGCFIASGSINNPKTSRYHLEFLIDDAEYAAFINDLLNEYELNSRIIKRKNGYMVYIKEAEKISDFLKIIKSYNGVLYFENVRIYRDQKNTTNRLNNCEQANIEKTINTALRQIDDIKVISDMIGLDAIDEKLAIVADFRLKYPESSLLELSEIISHESSKKITKSCLNHRFRKLKEIADKMRDQ